jgi:hypothetical protein
MERIKVAENWFLDEFVDPMTYFKEADNGLSKVNPKSFAIAQLFRDLAGKPCWINNWWSYYEKYKNERTIDQLIADITKEPTLKDWSGLRTDRCKEGAPKSAHRILKGKTSNDGAEDMKCVGMNGQKMYDLIRKNIKAFYKLGLRRLEHPKDTPSWLHMDCREHERSSDAVKVVTPKEVFGYIAIK